VTAAVSFPPDAAARGLQRALLRAPFSPLPGVLPPSRVDPVRRTAPSEEDSFLAIHLKAEDRDRRDFEPTFPFDP
jgi:hypothetical protein